MQPLAKAELVWTTQLLKAFLKVTLTNQASTTVSQNLTEQTKAACSLAQKQSPVTSKFNLRASSK